jgi:sigma-B regulation protein RsbU (phosphoserine phosphatase)
MSYAMLRSLDEALAPGKRLARLMLVIAAIGMFAALIFAGLIANSLSKPVNQLVRVTEHIAEGKLATRAPVKGSSEIKTLGRSMNVMIEELEKSRRELAEKGRLEREMEIAMRIQTSILPRTLSVPGLQIAARMKPATEVGGDYYDVIPVEHGCWIGIGDVAGHGLTAGLEMLMVQSIISALVHENPGTYPREVISVLNGVIYDNVRNRIGTDEHVTLTLLRYRAGTITYAGAHEDILVWRADGTYEQIQTPGTWVGAMPKIADVTRDSRFELRPGDFVVLFSDGLTEAMNASREQFGIDRLRDTVAAVRDRSVEEICDHVIAEVEQWQASQDDDLTIVAFRRAVSA